MLFTKIIGIYCDNLTQRVNKISEQDAGFLKVTADRIRILNEFNPLTLNDLSRRRAVSPLKIKIPSKNIRKKPTNTPIIH
jgi:hypothetical protein